MFTSQRFLWVRIIVFLIITFMLFNSVQQRAGEGPIGYFLNRAVAPVEYGFYYLGRFTAETGAYVARLGRLERENSRYRKELAKLRAQLFELQTLRAENGRLRSALSFLDRQAHDLVSAEIVATSPNNWKRTVLINHGADAGLRKGMAVITPDGIVGRISEVRDYSAEVILISDKREGNYIGGVVARTRTMVIVSGGGVWGQCIVRPAVEDYFIDLKQNDLILTAENSDFFPRGLPIGRVVKVTRGSNHMAIQADLKPAVKIGAMQIVYVVRVKQDLPATPDGG
jgi:rod shape-determining protein MreC